MTVDDYACTRAEAATFLRVHIATIDRRLADGTLPSCLIGGRRLIPTAALRQLIDDNTTRRAS